MKVLTVTNLVIVVSAWTISAVPASAQDTNGAPAPKTVSRAVEVTPFVSIDSRGSSPVGAAISVPLGSRLSIESEVGHRRGEGGLNALSSSANLLYVLPRIGRTTPYLATGAGLAQYGAPIISTKGPVIGTDARIALEVNAGAGVKVPVHETWGMRTDARWFKTFGRDASEHWRVSHGISFDVRKR